jgi:hypothetical protein
VTGELVTASLLNTHLRDNLSELRLTPFNRCIAYASNSQNVSSGNTDALTLDAEEVDTASIHSTSSSTNLFTIPAGGGGAYDIWGRCLADSANSGSAELQLRKNGTAVEADFSETAGSNFEGRSLKVGAIGIVLAAGDTIDLAGAASGSTMTFGSATARYRTRLSLVGPLPPA